LCDLCQQKPKAHKHNFCSKTCASFAATLCAHCRQRQKFGSFEYCGKACRDAAKGNSTSGNSRGAGGGGSGFVAMVYQALGQVTGTATAPPPAANNRPAPRKAPGFAPPIPRESVGAYRKSGDLRILRSRCIERAGMQSGGWQGQQWPQPQRSNIRAPAMAPANSVPPAAYQGAPRPHQSRRRHVSQGVNGPPQYMQPPAPQTFIPSYGHVENEYDEESYDTGVALCIMCQANPQSESDHFCSQECKDQAVKKA